MSISCFIHLFSWAVFSIVTIHSTTSMCYFSSMISATTTVSSCYFPILRPGSTAISTAISWTYRWNTIINRNTYLFFSHKTVFIFIMSHVMLFFVIMTGMTVVVVVLWWGVIVPVYLFIIITTTTMFSISTIHFLFSLVMLIIHGAKGSVGLCRTLTTFTPSLC